MELLVAAPGRLGGARGADGVSRPLGLQHGVRAGHGSTLCGVPLTQLHVFATLAFPQQVSGTCRSCLAGLARLRAS